MPDQPNQLAERGSGGFLMGTEVVERFEPRAYGWGAAKVAMMEGVDDGRWVRYSDYEQSEERGAEKERERWESAVEALPDPEKLRLLAEWFDAQQDAGRWGEGRDVQHDLRRWADAIAALAALDQEGDRG